MGESRAEGGQGQADRRGGRTPWAVYLGLTAVAWGALVLVQGLWHDEVQILFRAFAGPERGEGLLSAITTPTRRLLRLPSLLALASGRPVQVLHLLMGLSWLAAGLLAERLARRLWPDAPAAAPLAGALALSATPDFFTGAPVALGYQLSIVAFLGAALASLAWLQGGPRRALWAVPLCLTASLWTSDAAAAAWALAPLLWAAAPGRTPGRERGLGALWVLSALPYLVLLLRQLAGQAGYFQQALVPMSAGQTARRWLDLALYNFTPWRWAFDRPAWFPAHDDVLPPAWRAALALGAAALACWALLRRPPAAGTGSSLRGSAVGVAAVLALMAVANGVFVRVQLSELYCRTHLLSRVFASLALARLAAAAWAGARGPVGRSLVRGGLVLWLGLGLAGGLERQDYFAGYWRAHRPELDSILAQAPALAPEARLLLRVPAHQHYLATEAGYLARAWASLLYQDPGVECRVFLWSEHRPTSCVPRAEGYECRGERSPDCQRRDGRETELLRYDRLVLLEYQPATGRYVLAESLPAGTGAAGASYEPRGQILPRERTPLARALLGEDRGLAATGRAGRSGGE